ncbi:ankyrin repeat domain-containing protein [Arthrobacter zhangbolii]|uniref:Ankyrin repeat domain-containing protein n=1 Tax=Arthrobacter zhangbolii TaxID=2886936 RepID=A0A9X1M8H6_9MICC|nr:MULTISPECIES: ankyrin repeat domain-containing protein [Arthrobacter]MCC3272670.1 ankyrin repeat domain-containing protein [Arthrobacter zhangbolii]MCC3295069.1 ankyrin repeat domain-containing protein [Arthrobacter zhangbolii]MDN3903732.1 ankyrin repeat domain-containing protein [Arthrobacter sp. YD2]UON91489.1 ankyrin repeat domain-containing protein [Arthrobacter zhangbolii]
MSTPESRPEIDNDIIELAGLVFDAARAGDTAGIRGYLDAGVPVNLTNGSGDTLIMLASYHGHAELTGLLVERGADVNTRNDRGQTPLAGAVFKGYQEIFRILLDAGADPDSGSPTARETAGFFKRQEMLDLLG